ncbi:hypothetical protein F2Q69_00021033 [Brassica cretica]|uniref:Uncharacterized protein n=1 Tax=Brassica cretica TaxID=69181 RepID=A0A8S9QBA0_BRACR|nr:hypothetical protein F2Q69_00021033 [Brassica cretica]
MEFDFWGSNGLAAGSAFSVSLAIPLIRSGIGLEGFVDVAAQCRFHPIRCSFSFGGSCFETGVVVSFLPCSVWIERLGSPESRTDRRFEGLMLLLTDREVFDFFHKRLQLDTLRTRPFLEVRSPLLEFGLEGSAKLVWIEIGSDHRRFVCPRDVPIGGIHCVWVVLVASLALVNPVGMVSVPESDPTGSMSLTLEGVVPAVRLESIVALRKLRSVS